MIKFIQEEDQQKELTFSMVEKNQFFETQEGHLGHKSGDDSCNIVASIAGNPCADTWGDMDSSTKINRILPKITKIEF